MKRLPRWMGDDVAPGDFVCHIDQEQEPEDAHLMMGPTTIESAAADFIKGLAPWDDFRADTLVIVRDSDLVPHRVRVVAEETIVYRATRESV